MKDKSDISQELLEIIERYINGSMTSQELKDFNQLLELDNDFKVKVEDIKTMLLGIETQSLKEQLDEFHKDIPKAVVQNQNKKKFEFLNFNKIAVAAAIIIAVGSIWFFNTPQNEKLYAKYFTPDPGLPTVMGTSNNFEFYDAMVNYKHGDYNIAIKKWELLQVKKPDNDTINYFLGLAHLANKNELQAISFLDEVTKSSESVFLNDTYYYLGLAYLKANNKQNAIKFLELSYSENSKELLEKLN